MRIKLFIVFLFLCFLVLLFFNFTFLQAEKKEFEPPKLQIKIPGLQFRDAIVRDEGGQRYLNIPWIADFISAFFKFFISAIVIIVMVMIMWGGFLWLTAAGSASQITQAKTKIINALVGLIIALGSYLILHTVNPTLVKLKNIKIVTIKPIYLELIEANRSGMLCTIEEALTCCCSGTWGCENRKECHWKKKDSTCIPASTCPKRCEELNIPKPSGIIIGNVKNNWWIVRKIAGVDNPCPTYCETLGAKMLADEQQGNDICCACKGGVGSTGHISNDTQKLAEAILNNKNITLKYTPDCGNTARKDLNSWAEGKPVETCPDDKIGSGCASRTVTPNPVLLAMINEAGKKYKFTITLFTGGIHGEGGQKFSYHYTGNAVDLDNLEDKEKIIQKMKSVFDDLNKHAKGKKMGELRIIDEETHLHIQIATGPSPKCRP